MKSANKYTVKVLATGFVTLLILSVVLFWARKACQIFFFVEMVRSKGYMAIQPSGLTTDLDSGSDVRAQSSIEAYIEDDIIGDSLGAMRDNVSLEHGKSSNFFIM